MTSISGQARSGLRLGVKAKVLLPIVLLGVVLALGAGWYLTRYFSTQVVQSTLDRADSLATQVRELRGYYTKNVVKRVKPHNIKVTFDYATQDAAIPLPATMVHELTDILSQKKGYTIRLYSEHPFPFRTNGGPRDAFEREAITALKANPQEPFWRLGMHNGVPAVRYASADRMVSEVCVNCHNSHPDTPKNDWKVGDVRGAIELIIPVEAALAASHAGALRVAGIIGLGVIAMLVFSGWNVHRLLTPVRHMAQAAKRIAVGDLEQQITHRASDETGVLANAFRDLMDYIKYTAAAASALSQGNLSTAITLRSEQDVLSKNLQRANESLQGLLTETQELVRAAKTGQLDKRGDSEKFEGAYRELVHGINDTLSAMTAPMTEANRALSGVANRDLTVRMQGDFQGDFATIKQALNMAVDNLDGGLGQVASGSAQVAAAVDQISRGSQTLAQGASEQASTLEEISSSLQEMSSMSQQNSSNAQEARGLSDHARRSADQGIESMQRLSQAIDGIKGASDETAKIVKTIDDIAFQTNLLALNAAVEAARAGDAGKGFAVVAEEVRNLAMRSAEAAKDTAQLINEAVQKSGDGVALNQEVLGNLEEIVTQVHKMSEVMGEIAVSSEQQQQGVDQLNVAVEQLNQVTQQTAANAEEAASTAQELSGQAVETQHLVGTFQLSRVAEMATSRSALPAASETAPMMTPPAHVVADPLLSSKRYAMSQTPDDVILFDDEILGDF